MNDVKLSPISLTEIHYFISKRQHGTAYDVCETALIQDPPDDYIDEYKFWKAFTMSDTNEGRRLISKIVANDGEYDAPEAVVAALAHLVLVPDSVHPSTPEMKEQFKTALKGCSLIALRNVTRYFLLTARLEKARQCVDRLVSKSPSPAVTAHSLAGHVYLTQALATLPFPSIAYVPAASSVPSVPSDALAPPPPEQQLDVAAPALEASLEHFSSALAHMGVGRARDPLALLGRAQHHALHRSWAEALKDLKRLQLIAPHCVAQADEKLRITCSAGLPQWPAVVAQAVRDMRPGEHPVGVARLTRWACARIILLHAALREGARPDDLLQPLAGAVSAAARERPRGLLLSEAVQVATRAAWVTHGDDAHGVYRAAAKALLPLKTDPACASEVGWQHLHLGRYDKAAATFDKLIRHVARAGGGPACLHTHIGRCLALSMLPADAAADPEAEAGAGAAAGWPSVADAMDQLRGCAPGHPAIGYWGPLLAATASFRALPGGELVRPDGSTFAVALKRFPRHAPLRWPATLADMHAAAWHPDSAPPAVLVHPGAAPLGLHDSYNLVQPADAAALDAHAHFMLPSAALEHLLTQLSTAARVYQRVHAPAVAAQRTLLAQELPGLLDLHFPLWLALAILALLQATPLGDTRAPSAPSLARVLRDAAACVTLALVVVPHARQLHLAHLLLVRARVLEMRAAQLAKQPSQPKPADLAAAFAGSMLAPAPGEPDIGPCLDRLARAPDGSIARPVLLMCETAAPPEPKAETEAEPEPAVTITDTPASAPAPSPAALLARSRPPLPPSTPLVAATPSTVFAPPRGPLSVMEELAELLGEDEDEEEQPAADAHDGAREDDEDEGAHFALATQRSPEAYHEFKAMVAQHAPAHEDEDEDSFDSAGDDIPELRDDQPAPDAQPKPAPDAKPVRLTSSTISTAAATAPRPYATPDMLVADVDDKPRPQLPPPSPTPAFSPAFSANFKPATPSPSHARDDSAPASPRSPPPSSGAVFGGLVLTPEQLKAQQEREERDKARVAAELARMKPLQVVKAVAFPKELVSPASAAAVAAETESSRRWVQATEFVRAALIGDMFVKYGRHGAPHHRSVVVRIMPDNRTVCVDWGTGQLRFHKNNARVLEGAQGAVFQRAANRKLCAPERCFSIVTAERSLDLEASSEEDRDYWVKGMRLLLAFLWD